MARDFNGSTSYMRMPQGPFPEGHDHPWTWSCWFKPGRVSGPQVLIHSGNDSITNHAYVGLEGNKMNCFTRGAIFGNKNLLSSSACVIGGVYHIAGVIERNYKEIFFNGVSENTEAATNLYVKSVMDSTALGSRQDSSPGRYYQGTIWSVALHQARLTADQVMELYLGAPPPDVAGEDLHNWWPLEGPAVYSQATQTALPNTFSAVVSAPVVPNGNARPFGFTSGQWISLPFGPSGPPLEDLVPSPSFFTVTWLLPASATITGSILTATEQQIRDGGLEIILTLTNATWLGAGEFSFDAIRQDIIDGLVGAASPTNGWNNEVLPNIPVTAVVREDDETVVITLPAFPLYNIDGDEGVVVTIPGVANSTEVDILPSPLFFVVSGGEEPEPSAPEPRRLTRSISGRKRRRPHLN
jgi:hypothetical protein